MQSDWHPKGLFRRRRYMVSPRAKARLVRGGRARLTILMVSKYYSAIEGQESWLISTDPHSSPASPIGQRPSRGTRGSRRSQLQASSNPLVRSKVDDSMEEDPKDSEEKANDMAGNEEENKVNVNSSKASSSKAKNNRRSRRKR